MSIPNLILSDGRPNPSAMLAAGCICAAIYAEDRPTINGIAQTMGASVLAVRIDLAAYQPDYAILSDGNNCLVVFDGTTNIPQWLGHSASAVVPVPDLTCGSDPVMASFYLGLAIVEAEVVDFVNRSGCPNVLIVGHSYGGACAFILARHFRAAGRMLVYLMTFGEPKSYTGVTTGNMPLSHNRIVNAANDYTGVTFFGGEQIDVVPNMPPGQVELFWLNLTGSLFKLATATGFTQYGERWLVQGGLPVLSPESAVLNLPFAELSFLADGIPFAALHLMGTGYLPRCVSAWNARGIDDGLSSLVGVANSLTNGTPPVFPDRLSPPLPSPTINDAFFTSPGVVTEANRTQFSSVVVSGRLNLVTRSFVAMPITPYQVPTFKGTYFLNQLNGGSSFSVYAANPPTPPPSPGPVGSAAADYNTMMNRLLNLKPFRENLSITNGGSPGTLGSNPLTIVAVRVEDERISRDSLLNTNPPAPSGNYWLADPRSLAASTNAAGILAPENLDLDAAFHIVLSDGNGHSAGFYLHGVPVMSLTPAGVGSTPLPIGPGSLARANPVISPPWLALFRNFVNQLIVQGLGFRFAYVTWTPLGQPQNGYPSLGNGSPATCWYNFPMTPSNTYTFGLSQLGPNPFGTTNGINVQQLIPGVTVVAPNAPPILGKFIVLVRSMKLLRVINGRFPALGFFYAGSAGPPVIPAGYYVNVNRRAANYLPGTSGVYDNNGYLAPEVWSVVQPAPAGPPYVSALPPGGQVLELTSKKVGRPFEEQRGRARARVV